MAGSNKCWRLERFEPSQIMGVKKMISGNVSSELISLWFASVYGAASSIQNCLSPLVLRLQREQEKQLFCKMYSLTTSDLAVCTLRRKWQFQFGNIWKITKYSNFQRHFLRNSWLHRHKILHDNSQDQAKWHISKLYSFYYHFNFLKIYIIKRGSNWTSSLAKCDTKYQNAKNLIPYVLICKYLSV